MQSTEYYQLFYLQDLFVGPLYVLLFWFLTRRMISRNRQIPHVGRILYTGFILRIAGMLAFSLIMQYYYAYGDTFRYYNGAVQFRSLFRADYKSAISALFSDYNDYTPLMRDYLGEEFDGIISGVASFGFFVETVLHKCEGMVTVRDLNEFDEFKLDEADYALVGVRTGKKFRMGDAVKIKVVAANLEKRQLDYHWVQDENKPELNAAKSKAFTKKKK